jgi:hypothetical protein
MIEKLIFGKKVDSKLYYQEVKPQMDWQWMLVIGIVIGALISSLLSGDFNWQWIPPVWSLSFSDDLALRLLVGFAGGILLGFGSRWADGCTSGHGISGTMQLAISSWLSTICFFAGGILMAHLLFRVIL